MEVEAGAWSGAEDCIDDTVVFVVVVVVVVVVVDVASTEDCYCLDGRMYDCIDSHHNQPHYY